MMKYHNPVMLQECIDGLLLKSDGIYLDVTFGGGGHSLEILNRLNNQGKLIAFDQDADVQGHLPSDDRFIFINQNFRYLKNNCRLHQVLAVDGILADLGVSSHQFDQADRGFSTRFDANLDMRMNQSSTLTAKKIINTYSEDDLHKLFGIYGEVKNAKTLVKTITIARLNQPIGTIAEFKRVIADCITKGKEHSYLAQVFQALRIEVNQELEALREFLEQAVDLLKIGGRLVVLSYHSLEDRLVKNFISTGKFSGELEKDFFGNPLKPLESIHRKCIKASAEELKRNNRARSAKLRIAVKR